jgi:hypothetical protein
MTSISYDGDGNYSIVFPCEEDDGFYSLTVQSGRWHEIGNRDLLKCSKEHK